MKGWRINKKRKVSRARNGRFHQGVTGARWAAFLLLVLGFMVIYGYCERADAKSKGFISPVRDVNAYATTPTPTQYIPQGPVEEEIIRVFGQYAPRAFLLLKGKGKDGCAENRTLNPTAVNRNWTKTPGVYSSSDWGVFQINDYWQGVSNVKFLTDYKINIHIAWLLFKESGYSFKLWTCGRVYGI